MRRLLLLGFFLQIPSSSAYGSESLIHFHDHFVLGSSVVTGTELSFIFQSQGRAPLGFSFIVPELFGSFPQQLFYESDTARLGFNWNELEALMAGPENKETIWGQPGLRTIYSFPYNAINAPQDFAKVDLNQIAVQYNRFSNFSAAVIYFYGERYLVPEPSSVVLSFVCFSMFMMAARQRTPGALTICHL